MTTDGRAPVADTDQYEALGPLRDARIDAIPAGSNLLLCGPTKIGKTDVALQTLTDGYRAGYPVMAILTNTPPNRLERYFESIDGQGRPSVHVIDARGQDRRRRTPGWLSVSNVSSPGDLTGIGIGVAKATKQMNGEVDDGLYTGVVSLSTLLQYGGPQRVFNFSHVVAGRIAAAGYLGSWLLDTDAHDATTVNTLKGMFEYVAEMRERDDGTREIRVLGGPIDWRAWQPLSA